VSLLIPPTSLALTCQKAIRFYFLSLVLLRYRLSSLYLFHLPLFSAHL
jgi:hypothetical protein